MARKALDTRRQRTPSARAGLRQLEDAGKKARVPLRTGRRPGVVTGSRPVFDEKPSWFPGTLPEWAIYWAHQQLRMTPGQDFIYISYIAGIQVDFEEIGLQVSLNIQGLFWHYEFGGSSKIAEDIQTRAIIESTGMQLIDIDEDNALADPIYFLREALAGRDHSLQSRGVV